MANLSFIKIRVNCYFMNFQAHFPYDLFFVDCYIFPQVIVMCLHLIKDVSLDFNILLMTFLVFKACFYSNSEIAESVMKCKIVMLSTSRPFSKNLHF